MHEFYKECEFPNATQFQICNMYWIETRPYIVYIGVAYDSILRKQIIIYANESIDDTYQKVLNILLVRNACAYTYIFLYLGEHDNILCKRPILSSTHSSYFYINAGFDPDPTTIRSSTATSYSSNSPIRVKKSDCSLALINLYMYIIFGTLTVAIFTNVL